MPTDRSFFAFGRSSALESSLVKERGENSWDCQADQRFGAKRNRIKICGGQSCLNSSKSSINNHGNQRKNQTSYNYGNLDNRGHVSAPQTRDGSVKQND